MKTGLFPAPDQDADDGPFRRGNYAHAYAWLEEVDSLQALQAHVAALSAADPTHRYLCTLDDINQCSYTSGHAAQDDRLYLNEPNDDALDWDDPAQVAAWEGICLQHRVQQLQSAQLQQSWASVCGTLSFGDEDLGALLRANREPDQLLDTVVYIQRLPVASDDLMIAGQPNGYFSADWDSFQNHAIIRHLAQHYGYRFFAMGAAWMGFVRAEPLDATQAQQLVTELQQLYEGKTLSADPAWQALTQVLQQRSTLMLGYTEGMAETLPVEDEAAD